jgi:hypothetical protein
MTALDIATLGEICGHVGSVWVLTREYPTIDLVDLTALAALDDDDRVATVENLQDALVDIRDWATRVLELVDEAGAE